MSVRLFVLGILNDGEAYGYQIKEIARASNLEKWADVGYGSIYHALKMMAAEGTIEEVGVSQVGDRPPRSVYRITPAGRAAFFELLRETTRYGYHERHPINLALSFLAGLPSEERVQLLSERLRKLEARQALLTDRRKELAFLEQEAPWVLATIDHDQGHVAFEIEWTRNMLTETPDWQPRPKQTHL